MQTINLKRIIKASGLKSKFLAGQLFPDHVRPDNALSYIVTGKSNLDSQQIAKLSEILNVPIGMLFDDAEWEMLSPPPVRKRVIQFKAYDYFAELDLDTMTTTVSRNGAAFFEKIVHKNGVLLTDYLNSLTDLIIKYK